MRIVHGRAPRVCREIRDVLTDQHQTPPPQASVTTSSETAASVCRPRSMACQEAVTTSRTDSRRVHQPPGAVVQPQPRAQQGGGADHQHQHPGDHAQDDPGAVDGGQDLRQCLDGRDAAFEGARQHDQQGMNKQQGHHRIADDLVQTQQPAEPDPRGDEARAAHEQKLPEHEKEGGQGQHGKRFLQQRAPGGSPPARGAPAAASTSISAAAINRHLLVSDFTFTPRRRQPGIDLSGVMVMASTGQYIRHKWQIWQSATY